jgi:hypothetical protein
MNGEHVLIVCMADLVRTWTAPLGNLIQGIVWRRHPSGHINESTLQRP